MQSIYVDIDDVLSKTGLALLNIIEREFGKKIAFENITGFDLKKTFDLTQKEYDHFFELAHQREELLKFKPIENSIETLSWWKNQGHQIIIVTGRPTSAYDFSLEWLAENKVPYHSFIIVDKYGRDNLDMNIAISLEQLREMKFDFAVEDSFKMAKFLSEEMNVQVALLSQPWNRDNELNEKITLYDSWTQIRKEYGIE